MNRSDGFERELTAWMLDVATPSVPDYVNDIVRATAGRRQRPRWTFPERWLPMTLVTLHPVPTKTFPWRAIAVLAVIAALTAALVVVAAGNRKRSPAPFGLAANGLLAYAAVGDIWTVDPMTGEHREIVTGPEPDHDPRWSPDGDRIAFLRDVLGRQQVVIVAADGRGPSLVASRPIGYVDDDAFKWAPDGRSLIVSADLGSTRALVSIDAANGATTTLPFEYGRLEPFWRPPDGREVLFVDAGERLIVASMETGQIHEIRLPAETFGEIRPMGWTPDGRRVVVHRSTLAGDRTFVIDVASSETTTLDIGFGHVSNGGDRVAGLRDIGGGTVVICVVELTGGPCQATGPDWATPEGSHFEGLQWSPDDRYLALQPLGGQPVLLDPVSGRPLSEPDWGLSGAETWQRVAP